MDPNSFDAFRRSEVYPFFRGTVSGQSLDYFRRGQALANMDMVIEVSPGTYIQRVDEMG